MPFPIHLRRSLKSGYGMDCRIKSGNDGVLWLISMDVENA